jgi:hypothetical protein
VLRLAPGHCKKALDYYVASQLGQMPFFFISPVWVLSIVVSECQFCP